LIGLKVSLGEGSGKITLTHVVHINFVLLYKVKKKQRTSAVAKAQTHFNLKLKCKVPSKHVLFIAHVDYMLLKARNVSI
jgi:hypothetical protein